MDFDADDTNWYAAKEILNETLKGRQIVEYTEKNIKTNSIFPLIPAYLIRKNDCETMVRSYVDDCGQFLDIANRENVRILAGKTLIWSLDTELFSRFMSSLSIFVRVVKELQF